MIHVGRQNEKIVWLRRDDVRHVESSASFIALFVFLLGACLAAELLARVIASWMSYPKSLALNLISTSGFL